MQPVESGMELYHRHITDQLDAVARIWMFRGQSCWSNTGMSRQMPSVQFFRVCFLLCRFIIQGLLQNLPWCTRKSVQNVCTFSGNKALLFLEGHYLLFQTPHLLKTDSKLFSKVCIFCRRLFDAPFKLLRWHHRYMVRVVCWRSNKAFCCQFGFWTSFWWRAIFLCAVIRRSLQSPWLWRFLRQLRILKTTEILSMVLLLNILSLCLFRCFCVHAFVCAWCKWVTRQETWKCSSAKMQNWLAWTKQWHWMSCRTRQAFSSLCVCVCCKWVTVWMHCMREIRKERDRELHAKPACVFVQKFMCGEEQIRLFTLSHMHACFCEKTGRQADKQGKRISYNKK